MAPGTNARVPELPDVEIDKQYLDATSQRTALLLDFVEREDLGPGALTHLGADELAVLLEGRRGSVKGALMDENPLACLGNIYTDEVLFQAGIHPRSAVAALDEDDIRGLHCELGDVVRTAIRQRAAVAVLPEHWLLPNREDGAPCPRCDGEIRKSEVSGRTTYHCATHQVLAR